MWCVIDDILPSADFGRATDLFLDICTKYINILITITVLVLPLTLKKGTGQTGGWAEEKILTDSFLTAMSQNNYGEKTKQNTHIWNSII